MPRSGCCVSLIYGNYSPFSPPGDLLFPSALTNLAVLSYGEVDFASDSAQSSFQCRLDSALSKSRKPFPCFSLTHSHMALPARFSDSLISTSSEMVPAVLLTVLFGTSQTFLPYVTQRKWFCRERSGETSVAFLQRLSAWRQLAGEPWLPWSYCVSPRCQEVIYLPPLLRR